MNAPLPLVTIAKELVGRQVAVYTRGGFTFYGTLTKVADDGQALRLDQRALPNDTTTYVDLAYIDAVQVDHCD